MSAEGLISAPAFPVMQPSRRGKALWTTGNLMMMIGVYLLLYVGGLFADERFNLMVAQGDSDIAVVDEVERISPAPAMEAEAAAPVVVPEEGDDPGVVVRGSSAPPTTSRPGFRMPQLNNPGGGVELNSIVPSAVGNYGPSTVDRIDIPRIEVDRKVIEVGWYLEDRGGQQVAVWEVAKYKVGHHTGSANPGQGGNIVLAGHSGGNAYPFNDLFYLKPGELIVVWSKGIQYHYVISERLVLDEIGPNVTLDQRIRNARYIEPTDQEMVTLVTCWPLTGADKFNQRVVIRALPYRAPDALLPRPSKDANGGWTLR